MIEQAIQLSAIEDQRSALGKGCQSRAPVRVERAALDADVGNRIGISKTSVHRNLLRKESGRVSANRVKQIALTRYALNIQRKATLDRDEIEGNSVGFLRVRFAECDAWCGRANQLIRAGSSWSIGTGTRPACEL